MELFYIISIVLVLAGGLGAWFMKLNWKMFFIPAVAALLLTIPVHPIWYNVEKTDKETFNEYWNGVELAALKSEVTCTKDGVCVNTYDCDPYVVPEVVYTTNSEGETESTIVMVTKYHDCPYSSQETSYTVNTTLGEVSAGKNLMTGPAFRAERSIPGGQVTEPPALWTAAKERVEAGKPGGVTKTSTYKNYILGSDLTIFKKFSEKIEEYKERSLLPSPARGVHNLYQAQKTHFVGVPETLVSDELKHELADDVMVLNGRAGIELTADLHVVFVGNTKVPASAADEYTNILHAYWTSPEQGRNAIAKNTVTVVIGVGTENGEPVTKWARSFTGMPVGNEHLVQEFRNALTGVTLDEQFIGAPVYDVKAGKFTAVEEGAVESVLFGAKKFQRVSMTAEDAGDLGGGFSYLSDSYTLSGGGVLGVHLVAGFILLAGLVGGFLLAARNKF